MLFAIQDLRTVNSNEEEGAYVLFLEDVSRFNALFSKASKQTRNIFICTKQNCFLNDINMSSDVLSLRQIMSNAPVLEI